MVIKYYNFLNLELYEVLSVALQVIDVLAHVDISAALALNP